MKSYPLLDVRVSTPRLELRGATDELLDQLAEIVRAGKTHADPAPYDDPMSFYEADPDLRVIEWLRAVWRQRGKVEADSWRLHFVVVLEGRAVGEQTLSGPRFSALGSVNTFSWLSSDERGRGLGHEMRAAILHLAFDGLGAREATSDAFADNHSSNAISQALGYVPNGTDWATRQGDLALVNRWRLTRDTWERQRRRDIQLHNIDACHALLPLT
jgi:RimJ/RimL family protein N-acetyltransferase